MMLAKGTAKKKGEGGELCSNINRGVDNWLLGSIIDRSLSSMGRRYTVCTCSSDLQLCRTLTPIIAHLALLHL